MLILWNNNNIRNLLSCHCRHCLLCAIVAGTFITIEFSLTLSLFLPSVSVSLSLLLALSHPLLLSTLYSLTIVVIAIVVILFLLRYPSLSLCIWFIVASAPLAIPLLSLSHFLWQQEEQYEATRRQWPWWQGDESLAISLTNIFFCCFYEHLLSCYSLKGTSLSLSCTLSFLVPCFNLVYCCICTTTCLLSYCCVCATSAIPLSLPLLLVNDTNSWLLLLLFVWDVWW